MVSIRPEQLVADDSAAVYEPGGGRSLRATGGWCELAPGRGFAAVMPVDRGSARGDGGMTCKGDYIQYVKGIISQRTLVASVSFCSGHGIIGEVWQYFGFWAAWSRLGAKRKPLD